MTDSADHALTRALTLTPGGEALTAELSGEFSNGPVGAPPEAGFPFGGLLAALCAGAMRQGLEITGPLRTLMRPLPSRGRPCIRRPQRWTVLTRPGP